jgi:hypothetical protein
MSQQVVCPNSSSPDRSSRAAAQPQPPPVPSVARAPKELCEVCYGYVRVSELRGCSGCEHVYCRLCLNTYWRGAVFSGGHARLTCMSGGCQVAAIDKDVAAVVSPRTMAKLRYFRSRDAHATNPHVRWCPRDGCWREILAMPAPNTTTVFCPDCGTAVCYKCGEEEEEEEEEEGHAEGEGGDDGGRGGRRGHNCLLQRSPPTAATVEAATFHFWAAFHTKLCPSCHARIQRDHGCSHMTCSRCNAYFCWRCKGFLHSGAPSRGRPCVCDRIVGTALYSGLIVVGLVGLPVILTVCALGSGPYLIYHYARRHETRAREHRANVLNSADIDDNDDHTSGTDVEVLAGARNVQQHAAPASGVQRFALANRRRLPSLLARAQRPPLDPEPAPRPYADQIGNFGLCMRRTN